MLIAGGMGRYRSTTPPGVYRLPWVQPFAANSYINKGVGSGALFGNSNDVANGPLYGSNGGVGAPYINKADGYGCPVWVGDNTGGSSSWFVQQEGIGTYAGDPNPSGYVQVPNGAYLSQGNPQDNEIALFDKTQPKLFICAAEASISGTTLSGSYICWWDTTGNGVPYAGFQGAVPPPLRGQDFSGSSLNRVLPCAMPAYSMYCYVRANGSTWGNNGYNCVWPARASDYKCQSNPGGDVYNPNSGVPFGSIIFVPKGVFTVTQGNMNTLMGRTATAMEMAVAYQAQNYGFIPLNQSTGLTIYGDQTITSSQQSATEGVWSKLYSNRYFRVMASWMYSPTTGMIGHESSPASAPGAGYQYDLRYNASAPINGGGTYPYAPPNFDPSIGIGNGASYSGANNGWGAP